jgi:poly-gamma-glutamate synthesis protein (capsule biosynthesis protein)
MKTTTKMLVGATFCCLVLPPSSARAEDEQDDRVVRITLVGDVCLDGGPGHVVTNGEDPLVGIASLFEDTDLAVANLECALPMKGKGQAESKSYTFKAPTESISLLKRYFSAVSLANNHARDWGKEGFASQLDLFDREQLPYFGGGRNIDEARRPLILSSHGRRVALLGYCDISPRRFSAGPKKCGTAWLVETDVLADIKTARTKFGADTVIPYLHWGTEHTPTPEDYQTRLARRMIEAGADAVIGAHPHVTQTVEWYQGKPIIYSLGNCVFNYFPRDLTVYYGWSVQLTFGKSTGIDLKTTVLTLDPAGLPHIATSDDKYR